MMKRFLLKMVTLCMTIGIFAVPVCAEETQAGKYTYQILGDGTAQITGYNGNEENIILPATIDGYEVTSIGEYAIQNKDVLKSVEIPEGITEIGMYAFSGCTNVEQVSLPNSLKSIGAFVFTGSSMSKIVIPDGVEFIGSRAFANSHTLRYIGLPLSVTKIEMGAFNGTIDREQVYYAGSDADWENIEFTEREELSRYTYVHYDAILSEGSEYPYQKLSDDTVAILDYVGNEHNLVIPNEIDGYTVFGIADGEISRPEEIHSVTISEGIKRIGEYAFAGCSNLTEINIPDSVTEIGMHAFNGTAIKSVRLPESLEILDTGAFMMCENLTSLEIPKGVTKVAASLCDSCTNLQVVKLPEGITEIGMGSFWGCTSLSEINIPSTLREWDQMIFYGCIGLTRIIIPEGVTVIRSDIFRDCTSLSYVELPKSIELIGVCAFEGCTSLNYIKIPESTKSIQSNAFFNCSNLEIVELPKGLEEIDWNTFDGCNNLTRILYRGSETDWNSVLIRDGNQLLGDAVIQYDYNQMFWDVSEADWFYDAVQYTYENEIMTGMDAVYFGPYGQLSRAQFALILYRINGEPEVTEGSRFADINGGEWYGPAVLWSAENGIVTGYQNGCFGPADMITREQMALMMYRYAKYLGKDISTAADISTFTDAASVSGFAVDAMKWANGMGIITGKDNGTKLDPQGNTARAEAAVIIQRFMK